MAETAPEDRIDYVTPEVSELRAIAELPRALGKGTRGMRAGGEKWLPRARSGAADDRETGAEYQARLDATRLHDGFGKTVKKSVGRVFHRPPAIVDTPASAALWMERCKKNFDGMGSSYTRWGRDVFGDTFEGGVGFALVDKKPTPEGETGGPVAMQRKPYAVYYPIERTYGWQLVTGEDGVSRIAQIRFRETYTEQGTYAAKRGKQIRLLEPDHWETWRESSTEGEWDRFDEGAIDLGEVPVEPFFGLRLGAMSGITPLESLADANLIHYQSDSAQRRIINVVRVPTLVGYGVQKGEGKSISIGLARMLRFRNPPDKTKVEWLEHDGKSIEAGWTDLDRLEKEMAELGMEIRAPRQTGDVTAAANWIGYEEATSVLDAIAGGFVESMQAVLDLFARWEKAKSAGTYKLTTRDLLTARDSGDTEALSDDRRRGDLSQAQLWAERQRRGTLSEDFDPGLERERLAAEGAGERFKGTWRATPDGENVPEDGEGDTSADRSGSEGADQGGGAGGGE